MIRKAKEKLLNEKAEIIKAAKKENEKSASMQFDMVFEELLPIVENDPLLAENILKEHKTFQKCYKYMECKAKALAHKGATSFCVNSHVFFDWMREYYALDDEEDVKKEQPKKEEIKQEKLTDIFTELKIDSDTSGKDTIPIEISTKADVLRKKAKKNENPNQMSLFDMFE